MALLVDEVHCHVPRHHEAHAQDDGAHVDLAAAIAGMPYFVSAGKKRGLIAPRPRLARWRVDRKTRGDQSAVWRARSLY